MSHDSSYYFHHYNEKYQPDFRVPSAEQYSCENQRISPDITPASTVLNSPDLSECYYQHQHQIKVGRSPVTQHDYIEPSNHALPTENLGAYGDAVVFDDIDHHWRNEPPFRFENETDTSIATNMIDVLPIGEYEESPRRLGNYQQLSPNNRSRSRIPMTSLSLFLPRPGFPQRIMSSASGDVNISQHNPNFNQSTKLAQISSDFFPSETFDNRFEFSETRKVLEDFFETSDYDGNSHCKNDTNLIFDNKSNNAYIGQRLANVSHEEQMLQCIHVKPQVDENKTSKNDVYISIDDQVDADLDKHLDVPSRTFTVSPELTKSDSNCDDLDNLSNDIYTGVMTDFTHLYTSMPVLEDGLSSGHSSDNENKNPNNLISVNNKLSQNEPMDLLGGNNLKYKPFATEQINEDNRIENKSDIFSTGSSLTKPPPSDDVENTLRDIRTTLQRTKILLGNGENSGILNNLETNYSSPPIWISRNLRDSHESLYSDNPSKPLTPDEEEADTDLETDRLLGQQRLSEQSFGEEKANWCDLPQNKISSQSTQNLSTATIRQGIGISKLQNTSDISETNLDGNNLNTSNNPVHSQNSPASSIKSTFGTSKNGQTKNKEGRWEPAVLIEGVLFRAKYLGSTQLVCEGQPTKSTRMMQAEEAVSRIKAPDGETQPSTEVDLFISTEKIMVLNTDLKEIMMDHALRTISYIADIGDLVVLMARRRFVTQEKDDVPKPNRTPKMICHVFESDEAQFIAQSIGQAFQVAYMQFLKANGIEDHTFVKEMDYQEVLNSQEIFGDELEIFAKKELQKEVVVPKMKGEILGVVIVESGWGSMLPTVVIANLLSTAAAARCGQLNIGDQIIAINGLSLVGLPLSTCQSYIRNTKNQSAVKFTVVPCPPVVEVKIKRPNTKYQLGFSVQNGVICSLLRGGIAERGGVRVGHRIIEINNQSVVAVPHEKIVSLLATSVGEILMKTMPTSMFRLLTGQENPVYI